ncbi:MAG: fibronectin type III domain-containing protein [Ignavibacteria bacterium]|nr:fibronectin type III domain-containing protein [Ignavibacteria bacterium]
MKKILQVLFITVLFLSAACLTPSSIFAQPPAPANFTSGTVTASSVVLNWTPANGGEDGFRIVWKPGNTAPSTNTDGGYHNVSGGNTSTYTVTGLQAGQQYTFSIYSTQLNSFSLTAPTVTITTNNYNSTTFINEQAASLIFGQSAVEDISNTNAGGLSASSLFAPYDVFVLPGATMNSEGKVFVVDKSNNRVLIFNSMPTSNKQQADVVIGQSDFTSNGSGYGANQLNNPAGVVSDGTRLFIADEGNNRILVFNTIPVSNGASANIVLGQTTFGAGHTAPNNGGRSASTLYFNNGSSYGTGMALYTGGFSSKLIVCDGANDRVLIWDDFTSLTNGKAADHVIGQTNFTTNSQPNTNSSTAATLYSPKDVAVTSTGKLFVLSRLEHRVLIYNSIPTTNGASADNVLGQTDFANNQANFTNSATSMSFPRCLAVSALDDRLCIAASGNRLLVWNTIPASNNVAADNILGMANLTASSATTFSNENNGPSSNFATNVSFVDGICWTDAGNLLCADANRSAVLKFNGGAGILTSPSSVTAGTITANSVQVNWSGSAAEYFNVVYRYGTTPPTGYDDPLIVGGADGVSGNTVTFSPVPCGTQLSFAVLAKKTQFGSQYAAVNGTLNTSSGSSSCINFPIFDNGSVFNIANSITGDTIFCAGSFSKIYSKTGTAYTRRGLCAIDSKTGNLLNWVCDVGTNQSVNQVLVNRTNGKLYVGGSFSTINGVTRDGGLAALNPDGTVYTTFNPVDNNGGIGSGQGGTCMTFNSTNDTLFFWGPFTSFNAGSITRNFMAAVLCSNGSLTDFVCASPPLNTATCRLFALSPTGKSILMGSNNAGLELRSINISTGTDAGEFDWQTSGGLAASLWYDGVKYLYIGGSFDTFMGQNNVRKLAKVDMSGPTPVLVTSWNNTASTRPNAAVRQIFGTSSALYIAGDFADIGGTERKYFGAVKISDASLMSFNPGITGNGGGARIALGGSLQNGVVYMCAVSGSNNSQFSAAEITVPPSITNGSTTNTVGAGATVNFTNSTGFLAKLTTNTSNLGSTTVTVSGANGDTTVINGYVVLDRIVTITPTTQPVDNVTVHIYALKSEMDYFASLHPGFGNSGNNYSGCKIHRLGAGNSYVQSFTPTITITDDIVDIAFDTPGFSSFAMSDDGLLPVELAGFTSSVNKNSVTLNWRTVSEQNNSGFDIERKKENSNEWIKAGNVQGMGTTNSENNYRFEDKNVASGKYYYRLKQIDYNGSYEYHNLTNFVQVGIPAKWDLSQNYPNPFNPSTKINFDIPKESFVKISVYDVTGRLVADIVNERKDAGYYTVEFNASALSSSIYFYRIEADNFTATKKMMLLK